MITYYIPKVSNWSQEFNMRSSVMIEGAPSNVVQEIIQDNLAELDAGNLVLMTLLDRCIIHKLFKV